MGEPSRSLNGSLASLTSGITIRARVGVNVVHASHGNGAGHIVVRLGARVSFGQVRTHSQWECWRTRQAALSGNVACGAGTALAASWCVVMEWLATALAAGVVEAKLPASVVRQARGKIHAGGPLCRQSRSRSEHRKSHCSELPNCVFKKKQV